MLKKLDKERPWPFEYIKKYPRSPFELPSEVLDHACGVGNRPCTPPGVIDGTSFKLLVSATPYKKKQRLDQTPRLDQTSAAGATLPLVPAQSPTAAASPGLGGGPFAAMMGAFMQAGMEHMGLSTMPAHGALRDAGPTLKFGPFNRKPSNFSARSDASHAPHGKRCIACPHGTRSRKRRGSIGKHGNGQEGGRTPPPQEASV